MFCATFIFQTHSRAGGVYMNTYEELQDQACADGIDDTSKDRAPKTGLCPQ